MPSTGYQIFTTLDGPESFNEKSEAIDVLFDLPSPNGNECYRETIKHQSEDLWAGAVSQDLVDKCASMTPSERLVFYNDATLVDAAYLDANDWIPT